jgi:hypothetical protein
VSWVTLLRMPWSGMRRSMRWIWLLVTAAFWLGAAACTLFASHRWPNGWMGAALILAFWLAFMGFLLGTLLLPAVEARHLRLPRLERAAALSLGLNGLLVLALTAAPLAFLSGHPLPMIELSLVALAAGLVYALLPVLWMAPACLCIPLLQSLAEAWHWRFISPLDPRFLDVCASFVAFAACVSTWSWRRVLRSPDRQLGWGVRPIVSSFRTSAQAWPFPATGSGVDPMVLAVRRTPRWLERQAELRDAGPRDLVRGVRVLLGGPYLPVTRRTLLRGLCTGAALAGFLAAVYLPIWARHGWRWSDARSLLAFAVIFASAMVLLAGSLLRSMHLAQRWSRPAGELAVMPLLPRLGAMREQTSRLLRVVFTRMRTWHIPLILVPLAIEWLSWHDPVRTLILLAVLGMAPAAEVTLVYCTLGHSRIRPWAVWILAVVGLVSFIVGLNVTVQLHGVPPGWPQLGPLGACALCYAVLGTLAGRGWRALQRQPHPYFAVR